MKKLTALAWKEWREIQIYLWIGLGVFLGLPLIGALENAVQRSGHFEIRSASWVVSLGGILVVFVAVGSTCRDLSGRLPDFWRSRPVSITRWLLIKYLIALLAVLGACIIPLLAELWTARQTDFELPAILFFFPFFWLAIYSVAFAAGCLLRRTAHSAMAGLAGMLLVYFLPLILPPLGWMNVVDTDSIRPCRFIGGMMGIAVASATLALVAVRFDWHIESGKRMMYGAISTAILIIFASAAFQLGTNLPIQQELALPSNQVVEGFESAPDGDYLVVAQPAVHMSYDIFYRKIEANPSGITLSKPVRSADFFKDVADASAPVFSTDSRMMLPDQARGGVPVAFMYSDAAGVRYETMPRDVRLFHGMGFYELRRPAGSVQLPSVTVQLKLWNRDNDTYQPLCYEWNDRLYVIGIEPGISAYRLAVLDVSDPLNPKVLSSGPLHFLFENLTSADEKLIRNLPEIPGLPPGKRIEIALQFDRNHAMEGDTLCFQENAPGSLVEYHLSELSDTAATFTKVAEHKASLLQSVFGEFYPGSLYLQNGLLYEFHASSGLISPSFSVYGTRGPHPMQVAGHFAAPGIQFVRPLADGRSVVVAGNKLWLVGPPKNRQ